MTMRMKRKEHCAYLSSNSASSTRLVHLDIDSMTRRRRRGRTSKTWMTNTCRDITALYITLRSVDLPIEYCEEKPTRKYHRLTKLASQVFWRIGDLRMFANFFRDQFEPVKKTSDSLPVTVSTVECFTYTRDMDFWIFFNYIELFVKNDHHHNHRNYLCNLLFFSNRKIWSNFEFLD